MSIRVKNRDFVNSLESELCNKFYLVQCSLFWAQKSINWSLDNLKINGREGRKCREK